MSAVLLALSFPPLHLLIVPFVGLVPLVVWLERLPADAGGAASARRGATWFGVLYFSLLFYWILVALIWFTKLAILAFAASIGILAGLATLFGWVYHRARRTVGLPLWLALPVTWTAMEWARAHLPSTLAFPWLGLGTSLTGFPELVGIAEVVGARGVTFWIATVNALVAMVVLEHGRASSRVAVQRLVVIAGVVVTPMVWGVWRASSLELRPAGTVSVVQPNIPEHLKLDVERARDSTLVVLERLTPALRGAEAELIVLPEVVLTMFPRAPTEQPGLDEIQALSVDTGTPVLFGALGFLGSSEVDLALLNSAFLMEGDGLTDFQYDKHFLVPVVERVPFLPRSMSRYAMYFGGYAAGTQWSLAEVDGTRYGVLICYESSFPQAARALRTAGADVLLNLTNDAWYGREPIYARTTALWQHPAHLVMRAIENRAGVARSANTGISMFVDPIGRVHGSTALFEEAVSTERVLTSDVRTIYTRLGDWVGLMSAFLALLVVGQVAVQRLREGPSDNWTL